MNGATGRPTVLIAARLPDEFVQQLSARYDLLGPLSALFTDAVAALPPEDAARVRAVVTKLLVLPNVALSPQIAGGTLEARQAMQQMIVANLDAFFAGCAVVTPVPEALPLPQAAAAAASP